VMPTGGGKSMLFMLPAWVSGGLTVVVVPLIALRQDLQKRCAVAGISCVEWESRRPPDEAAIVLVTPESALSEDFITFLNRQQVCLILIDCWLHRLMAQLDGQLDGQLHGLIASFMA
jgi:superfamily II DNA helicase RecQ